jgi:hypothetical protein
MFHVDVPLARETGHSLKSSLERSRSLVAKLVLDEVAKWICLSVAGVFQSMVFRSWVLRCHSRTNWTCHDLLISLTKTKTDSEPIKHEGRQFCPIIQVMPLNQSLSILHRPASFLRALTSAQRDNIRFPYLNRLSNPQNKLFELKLACLRAKTVLISSLFITCRAVCLSY